MRAKILMLAAVTRQNRHLITAAINDAVVGAGGWIEGHTLFSNIATTFRFVLPRDRLAVLRARLGEAGVRLDAESEGRLEAITDAPARGRQAGDDEIAASLNLTFVHTEPDLRRDVPAVPG